MTKLQTHTRFGLLMSALALVSAPSAVLAQDAECATDSDCEHGYTCEEIGGACPAIDCAEGSDCMLPECESILGCVPARDCDADADCAEGWKCATDTYTECSGGAAEPTCVEGEECVKPEPVPSECDTKEVSYCAPPWALPCEEAADCGPGFECVERIQMSCSGSSGGSAGSPTPGGEQDAGSDAPDFAPPAEGDPLPPECTSEPSGEFYCQLVETECEVDSDCAAGLTCQERYEDSVCSGGATPPSAGDGDLPADGGAAPDQPADRAPTCEQPPTTFACAPPDYFDGGYGYDVDYQDGRGEATGGSTPDVPNGDGDTGGVPPAAPVDNDGEELAGDDDAGDAMSESSGCSATGNSRASGSALLMALAVLGLAFRKRALRA